jgi:hypothetical protein
MTLTTKCTRRRIFSDRCSSVALIAGLGSFEDGIRGTSPAATLWLRMCHRPGYLCPTLQEHIHMSVIRVGSSSGYAAGWEAIFGGGRKAKAAARAKPGKAAAVKKKAVRAARPAKSAKKRAAAKKARRR